MVTTMALPKSLRTLDPGLTHVDDRQLTCMVWGHQWPILELNRPLPKGFRPYLNSDGTQDWEYTCQRCTTIRHRSTLKYGLYDDLAQWGYRYPDWWIHFTLDDDMSRGRLKREHVKRMHDTITKAAVREVS